MVGARLPSNLVRELELIQNVEQADRSTTVRRLLARAIRDWKLEHAARQYGERRVSLSRAALDAGASLWEMIDYARTSKVSVQYDLEDLERDLEALPGGRPRR